MTKIICTIVIFCCFLTAKAQLRSNGALLDTLQIIAGSNTASNHFAKLYYNVVEVANHRVAHLPQEVQQFVFGFEKSFGRLFFIAHQQHLQQQKLLFNWKRYYSDTSLNKLQYQFIGMSAHINGDMWQALVQEYSYDSLKKYQRQLIAFQKSFNPFFDSIYNETKHYKKVKVLHTVTLGLDKLYGHYMVLHWRKRQVRLALLYYNNPDRFKHKWWRLQHNMERLDRFACKILN